MDNRQTNTYNAAAAGFHDLDSLSATVFAADTPLLNLRTILGNEIIQIETDHQKQLRNLGFANQKVTDLHNMGNHAWAICKIAEEYFKALPDAILQHKIAFHKSDLLHDSVSNMKRNAQTVYDTVNPVVAAMVAANYNITALKLSDLLADIAAVTADEGTPMTDIVSVQAATTALKLDFKNLRDTIDSILNLLVPYAATNPDVYNTCIDAFEVVNFGQRNLALRIVTSDSIVNTRLLNADITLDNGKNLKTSRRGIADFSHTDVPEGNYTITITLPHYNTLTIPNTAVFNNRMTRIEAKLVKI